MKLGANIRWMTRSDLFQVLPIEEESFDEDSAWDEKTFVRAMRPKKVNGLVIESDDFQILAYVVYEADGKTMEIINFAVHPNHRRRKLGSLVVDKLVKSLSHGADGFKRVTCYVPDASDFLGVHLFFKHCGFKAIGVKKGNIVFNYRLPVRPPMESPF